MKIELIFLALLGIALFSVGAYLLFNALITVIFGYASHKWPSVDGLITKSELKTGKSIHGVKAYWISLSYKYSVNGRSFTGKRIGFSKYGVASNNSTNKEIPLTIMNNIHLAALQKYITCVWRQGYQH